MKLALKVILCHCLEAAPDNDMFPKLFFAPKQKKYNRRHFSLLLFYDMRGNVSTSSYPPKLFFFTSKKKFPYQSPQKFGWLCAWLSHKFMVSLSC